MRCLAPYVALSLLLGTALPVQAAPERAVVDGCRPQVVLAPGQELSLLLPAIAATGYQWEVASPLTLLKQHSSELLEYQKSPEADPLMVGAAQKQVLSFTAIKAGQEGLTLHYLRPFERENIEQQCSLKLVVQ